MKRVFLTGMSGTGKSTVTGRLAALGYKAVDLDEPTWSMYDDEADWIWREERVEQLRATKSLRDEQPPRVVGCGNSAARR
jgi:shikimate kinase